jgi:hypothetical protein
VTKEAFFEIIIGVKVAEWGVQGNEHQRKNAAFFPDQK